MSLSFVAIDVGGTFLKGLKGNGNGVSKTFRLPMPGFLNEKTPWSNHESREIDANQLKSSISQLIELIEPPDDASYFVSGQMAGLAIVDSSGTATRPLISWQDQTRKHVLNIKERISEEELLNLGEHLRNGIPASTLFELKIPNGLFATSLIGFTAGVLAGTRAIRIHDSDASSWGLFNTRSGVWSKEMCDILSIDMSQLPVVSEKLAPAVPGKSIFVGIGDQQAALLGAGLRNGWVSVNLATGCQVSMLSDSFSNKSQTRPFFSGNFGGRYLLTKTHLPAGRLLTSALVEKRGFDDWEWLDKEGVEALPDAFQTIVDGIVDAVFELGGEGRPILFSGGIAQKFSTLQNEIVTRTNAPEWDVFQGNDASLEGLVRLAHSPLML